MTYFRLLFREELNYAGEGAMHNEDFNYVRICRTGGENASELTVTVLQGCHWSRLYSALSS